MSKTRADLVRQVGHLLAIIPTGSEMAAEDYDFVDTMVLPVVEDLRNRQVYNFPDVNAIEDGPFLWLAHAVAVMSAPRFGVSLQALAEVGVSLSAAETGLRMSRAVGPSGNVAPISYF